MSAVSVCGIWKFRIRAYGQRQRLQLLVVFFFFQAEDGIRDLTVTGVQTCALPISRSGPTHNGQMHLPWLGPLLVPSQFGGRYMHGLKRVGETWLYVSAGVGTAAIPDRKSVV